jgi:glycosyltransferase involved in cell wall biosynthesis
VKPVALVTGVVSDHRVAPFRALHERETIEILAWDDPGPDDAQLPTQRVTQPEAARLVGSGRYRAVIAGLGGRVALPATYAAARRARIPFVLWASLWAHPRTLAHALSYTPMRAIYRNADAVVTYGPHVTRYIEGYRSAGNVFDAPQAVEPEVFGRDVEPAERAPGFNALYVGRLVREKGIEVLLDPSSQATPSAQPPAGSWSTAAQALSCRPATAPRSRRA